MRHCTDICSSLSTNFSIKSSKLISNCCSMVLSLHEAASSQSKRLYFGCVCTTVESDIFCAVDSIDRLNVWICSTTATYFGAVNCRILYWRSDTNFPKRKPKKCHRMKNVNDFYQIEYNGNQNPTFTIENSRVNSNCIQLNLQDMYAFCGPFSYFPFLFVWCYQSIWTYHLTFTDLFWEKRLFIASEYVKKGKSFIRHEKMSYEKRSFSKGTFNRTHILKR